VPVFKQASFVYYKNTINKEITDFLTKIHIVDNNTNCKYTKLNGFTLEYV